jgi:hypothetical protein
MTGADIENAISGLQCGDRQKVTGYCAPVPLYQLCPLEAHLRPAAPILSLRLFEGLVSFLADAHPIIEEQRPVNYPPPLAASQLLDEFSVLTLARIGTTLPAFGRRDTIIDQSRQCK